MIFRKKNKLGILSVIILLCFRAWSQSINFTHFDTENGLPQAQIQTIQQDNDGNLWIGTMSGLSRYNGLSFVTFTKNDSLAENWITSSFKDSKGDLWFGHWGGGVSKYIAAQHTFINLDFDIISQFNPVSVIFEDHEGNFWFGTDGGGVYRYNIENNKVYTITSDEELSGNKVSGICEDLNENIWIGTNMGITIFNTQYPINDERAFNYLNIEKGLINNSITDVKLLLNDEMWIGTENAGLVIIKVPKGFSIGKIKSIKEAISTLINTSNGLASNNVKNIYQDHDGAIWIGTMDAGITKYVPTKNNRTTEGELAIGAFKTYGVVQGLNYNKVNAVTQDREGNMWIGTEVGLNQFGGERFQLYNESDGFANNIIWSVFTDSKGITWFGSNNGVTRVSWKKNGPDTCVGIEINKLSTSNGLSGNIILSIAEDNNGDLWLAASGNGLNRISENGTINRYSAENGLPDNVVYSIAKDKSGNMWFGTKKGAVKYLENGKRFITYTSKDGLSGDHVYRIFSDSKGNLWFGILGGTLTMYNGKDFNIFDKPTEVANKFALTITEDNEGKIWVGTYGAGVFKYDGSTFTNYKIQDGLSSESPSVIICDKENNIWIGSSKGLDKYNQSTKRFMHYGKQQGFLGIETNANAASKDKNGKLWFGTIMGAVSYDSKNDRHNNMAPKTSIVNLKVNLLDRKIVNNSEFTYNENHLIFSFIGVSLTNPVEVRYSYKMEGFDENWSPPSKEILATYSNLPPDEYKFLVKAGNEEGVWNKIPTAYTFTIIPPFWQTYWFYGICIATLTLAVYVFDKLRTASLTKEKKILEEKVKVRTLELAAKNAELAEKNEDITASIRYAKRIQEAILPPRSIIKRHYPDSFIYYRPKDIVSGDFYWMEEKNNTLMFAAVDCTGHGVPGAFMSIIGNNILSALVNKENISQPSKILENLSKGVFETLRQTSEDHTVKDAMDLSFCVLDLKTNKLQFAAAYNPLYLVRGKELIETKADRQAIGLFDGISAPTYTNHEINLVKGDAIYISSDGYIDQFGGKRGKKFMNKRFKQLLIDIQEKTMDEQEKILETTLLEWRGKRDQIDDILVMGLRI